MAALSRELIARGKQRLFLTTDVANPTSNAIYARIGFVPETDDYHFDFVERRRVSHGGAALLVSLELTPATVGRTIALPAAAAHHAVRVVRLGVGDALTLFDGNGR